MTYLKNRSILLCFGFIFFLLNNAVYSQGLVFSPMRVFFTNAAGQSSSQSIEVRNTGTEQLVLNTSLQDWYRDSLGNKVYSAAGTLPGSNAEWIKVFPEQLTIAPQESKQISVSMNVPADASQKVSNCMLFLTQINAQKPSKIIEVSKGKNVGVIIKLQAGIHIYNTFAGLFKKDLEFVAFEDRGLINDSTRRLAITVANNGEVSTDGHLRFELTNKTTGDELKQEPLAITMLPGAKQIVYIKIPAQLTNGKYLAEAVLDTGNDNDLKVAQKEVVYE